MAEREWSENIQMSTNVYIGLAVTAHSAGATCEGVFINVTTTGSVGQQWSNQDIGIVRNAPEPLYVALSNSAGAPAVMTHDNLAAAKKYYKEFARLNFPGRKASLLSSFLLPYISRKLI